MSTRFIEATPDFVYEWQLVAVRPTSAAVRRELRVQALRDFADRMGIPIIVQHPPKKGLKPTG